MFQKDMYGEYGMRWRWKCYVEELYRLMTMLRLIDRGCRPSVSGRQKERERERECVCVCFTQVCGRRMMLSWTCHLTHSLCWNQMTLHGATVSCSTSAYDRVDNCPN